MHAPLKKQLLDLACTPYRPTGMFNYRWARGKLAYDPIFDALIKMNVFTSDMCVMDLGCGRGLLAAWLLAAESLATQGQWPGGSQPAKGLRFRGVELMAREADCGNRALRPLYGQRVQLSGGDMRLADLSGTDAIAILDVLHYIPVNEQENLLDRVRAALGPGGVFVTRVGNADGGLRFKFSRLVDRCMSFAQGHRLAPTWCRPLPAWIETLERRGFGVEATPMSRGTPFANVMLIARVL